jgi:hypothetical protein
VADAMALVDRALEAERNGLAGRAYIDLANRDPVGDAWLESTAKQIAALGFDSSVDREAALMPASVRCDAPALYFGWYASEAAGPFMLPGFGFAPGAIALHIYSFSAATLRGLERGWTGMFVARGVTATVGNVHEPYLMFTHRPDLLLRALARGETWVDATYYALQALSWQAIVIGDPLYRPFAVSLEEQIRNGPQMPATLSGYVVARKMHQLEAAGQREEATALAVAAQRDRPTYIVACLLAQRRRAAGDLPAAGDTLGIFARAARFATNEWALARDAAGLLATCGRPAQACEVWRTLLASDLTDDLRVAWLPEAVEAAIAAKDNVQAATWRELLSKLTR